MEGSASIGSGIAAVFSEISIAQLLGKTKLDLRKTFADLRKTGLEFVPAILWLRVSLRHCFKGETV